MLTHDGRIITSTLDLEDQSELYGSRASGRTTRQIDRAVQILMNKEVCLVEDHHRRGGHMLSNIGLLDRIQRRLSIEHGMGSDQLFVEHVGVRILIYIK